MRFDESQGIGKRLELNHSNKLWQSFAKTTFIVFEYKKSMDYVCDSVCDHTDESGMLKQDLYHTTSGVHIAQYFESASTLVQKFRHTNPLQCTDCKIFLQSEHCKG